jgi:hypothetical protein
MVSKVTINIGTLAWLNHFDSFLLWLQDSRVLTIFRVSGRQPRRRMTVCYSHLAWLTLNEVVYSDYFNLAGAVVLLGWKTPLSTLTSYLVVFLPQHFCKLIDFTLLYVKHLLRLSLELCLLTT